MILTILNVSMVTDVRNTAAPCVRDVLSMIELILVKCN